MDASLRIEVQPHFNASFAPAPSRMFGADLTFTGFLQMTSGFLIQSVGGVGMGGAWGAISRRKKDKPDNVSKAINATLKDEVRRATRDDIEHLMWELQQDRKKSR